MKKIPKRPFLFQKNIRKISRLGMRKKLFLTVFAFLFFCYSVLGSTYAWFTSEDRVENHFQGTRLSAEVVHHFSPNLEWAPGMNVYNRISIKNTGEVPALVRVSLYEFLLAFQIDTTTGNLARVSQPQNPVVEKHEPNTWQQAANQKGTYASNGTFYIAEKAIVPDLSNHADKLMYNDSAREQSALRWFQLGFSTTLSEQYQGKNAAPYWLYYDGYFYYSVLLYPNELSEPLLTDITLSSSTPNAFKKVLYQLRPEMEAHDATKIIFQSWQIDTKSPVYALLEEQLAKGGENI